MKKEKAPLTKLQIDFSDLKKLLKELLKKSKEDKEAWEITIRSELNCYVLSGNIEGIRRTWMAKDGYEMLWEIIDFFVLAGNRYDKKRLAVVWKKGDKYDDIIHAKDIKGDV